MLVLFRIDGIFYRPVGDVASSKAAIRAAVRSGGAFVPFLAGAVLCEIFITASSAIRIELVEDDEPGERPPDDEDRPPFDVDDL